MPMNGRCQELESTSHPHSSRRLRAGTRECQCQCPRRPQRRTVDREARRREASTFPRHHWTGARNSHLKCPIGQTVAKSLEKWTSNLRTYMLVHSQIPCPLTTPPPAVMRSFSLDVHTDFSHVRVHFFGRPDDGRLWLRLLDAAAR